MSGLSDAVLTRPRQVDIPNPQEPFPLSAVILLAAVTAAVMAQGGYYAFGQVLLGLLLATALVLVGRRRPAGLSGFRPVAVASAALTAWAVTSATIAGHLVGALSTVLLLAAVMTALLVARQAAVVHARQLANGLIVLGTFVGATGWIGVAWRMSPWALEDQGLWRAATSVTYSNAAAGLLVSLVLLSLGCLADRRRSVGTAVACCVMLTALGATLSRGGLVGLAVGLAVLCILGRGRRLLTRGVGPAIGAVVALAGLIPSMPDRSNPRPVLAIVGLVIGLGMAVALEIANHNSKRIVAAAGILVLGVAAAASSTAASDIRRPRFSLSSTDRVRESEAALRLAADHPLTGTGPNRAVLSWTAADGGRLTAQYAHNEYLQALAELGVVGLGLLGAFLFAIGELAWRGRPRVDGALPVHAGAIAGLVALAAHSALDFLWHIPAIPIIGAVLVGIASSRSLTEQELP